MYIGSTYCTRQDVVRTFIFITVMFGNLTTHPVVKIVYNDTNDMLQNLCFLKNNFYLCSWIAFKTLEMISEGHILRCYLFIIHISNILIFSLKKINSHLAVL